MIQQATLTKVYRSNKDKSGKELRTHDGRPYTKLAIRSQEYGDKWLSGFDSLKTSQWREGDTVEIDVEKVEKDGKEYLNFRLPNVWDEIRALKKRLDALEGRDDKGFEEANRKLELAKEEPPF